LVIHADPPGEQKAYVHRSGRTARGGADGTVVTLQTRSQSRDVTRMMREAGVTPQVAVAEPGSDMLRAIAGPAAPPPAVPAPTAREQARRPRPGRPAPRGRAAYQRQGDRRPNRAHRSNADYRKAS